MKYVTPLLNALRCHVHEFHGAKRGRHLLTLCPLILSVFLDRINRINWMFFLFSLSGRKGERESAFGVASGVRRAGKAKESFYVRRVKRRT